MTAASRSRGARHSGGMGMRRFVDRPRATFRIVGTGLPIKPSIKRRVWTTPSGTLAAAAPASATSGMFLACGSRHCRPEPPGRGQVYSQDQERECREMVARRIVTWLCQAPPYGLTWKAFAEREIARALAAAALERREP